MEVGDVLLRARVGPQQPQLGYGSLWWTLLPCSGSSAPWASDRWLLSSFVAAASSCFCLEALPLRVWLLQLIVNRPQGQRLSRARGTGASSLKLTCWGGQAQREPQPFGSHYIVEEHAVRSLK
jgi:hypothetical protein